MNFCRTAGSILHAISINLNAFVDRVDVTQLTEPGAVAPDAIS
jgi:hypothetical protein